MVTLETTEKKIILPIWHEVNRQQVIVFSPILGDSVAITSELPLDEIVLAIEAVAWIERAWPGFWNRWLQKFDSDDHQFVREECARRILKEVD